MQLSVLRIERVLFSAVGGLALFAAATAAVPTYAADMTPASCNALVSKYFGAEPGSTANFTLESHGASGIVSYVEGNLTLSGASGLAGRLAGASLAREHVRQFLSDRRYPVDGFAASGPPFSASATDQIGVHLSNGPVLVRGLGMAITLESWGNSQVAVTPLGCVGEDVVYGTADASAGAVWSGIVSLALSGLQPPVIPR